MAILNQSELLTMDYSFNGQPFVVKSSSSLNLSTMDYSFNGQPFVVNEGTQATLTSPIPLFLRS